MNIKAYGLFKNTTDVARNRLKEKHHMKKSGVVSALAVAVMALLGLSQFGFSHGNPAPRNSLLPYYCR